MSAGTLHNAPSLPSWLPAEISQLHVVERVSARHLESEYHLIVHLVLLERESVIDQETRIALLPVRIKHLVAALQGLTKHSHHTPSKEQQQTI
jgi:hypothetical protein